MLNEAKSNDELTARARRTLTVGPTTRHLTRPDRSCKRVRPGALSAKRVERRAEKSRWEASRMSPNSRQHDTS